MAELNAVTACELQQRFIGGDIYECRPVEVNQDPKGDVYKKIAEDFRKLKNGEDTELFGNSQDISATKISKCIAEQFGLIGEAIMYVPILQGDEFTLMVYEIPSMVYIIQNITMQLYADGTGFLKVLIVVPNFSASDDEKQEVMDFVEMLSTIDQLKFDAVRVASNNKKKWETKGE